MRNNPNPKATIMPNNRSGESLNIFLVNSLTGGEVYLDHKTNGTERVNSFEAADFVEGKCLSAFADLYL
jgi:hypothetical protein